jgi:hypothetical protein
LGKTQPIGNQFLRIKAHLLFFRNTAERGIVHYIWS